MQYSRLRRTAVSGSRLAALCILISLTAILALRAASLAGAAGINFTVNDTIDRVDALVGDGVCRTSAGTCSLRAAIQETNALPGADAIQVPAGTYALAISPAGNAGIPAGDLDVTDSLVISGAGPSATVVDGGVPPSGAPAEIRGIDRVFEIAANGGHVTLSGLTISDGYAAEYGGGLMNSGSATVTIERSVVRGNTAGKTGGGVENHAGGTVIVRDSTVTQNYAVEGGSALNNNLNGSVEFANSIVSSNSAAIVGLDETLRGAGAIANNAEHDEVGTIEVRDSQISDNRAGGGRSGAGIWNKGTGRITVERSTFSKNWSDGDGGAIYSGPGEVSVEDSTFSENGGNNGGAISSGGSLTVLDSVFTKNAADDWGGGVHNYNLGGVAIHTSSFTDNSALSGGGLANEGSGLVTVESSTFTKNVAVVSAVLDSGDGGGMHSNSGGEVRVTGGSFSNNTARGGGGFSNGGGGVVVIAGTDFTTNTAEERGGGILVEGGDVRMVDIDVVGNLSKSAGEGGGGISYAGDKSAAIGDSAAIERSRIRDNKTDGEGGGIDSRGDGPLAISETAVTGNTALVGGALHHVGDAPLLVTRSTLARNVAEHAGGAFVDGDGEAAVENSTVSGNRAGQFGGGLLVSSRVTVRNTTVADNNAPSGGGVNNGGGPLISDGFVFLVNSIVANNPTGGNCVGTITSLGGNLENTNTCQLVAAGDQPGVNPLLASLASDGGPTQTHALLAGSPAQDAAVCTETEPCPEIDQRGVARPLFAGHDIGSYESELVPGGDPAPPPPGECPKLPNSLSAEADSWVQQGSPSNNSGSDSSLKVKSQSGSNSRILVRFPLPPLPEGCTTIASAVLRLNAASAKDGRTLAALQAANGWTESGVTWNNQPATTGPAATTASGQGQLQWDVTAQTLGSYVSGNHGFVIRDAVENGPGDEQAFNSREKATDGPPELLLVFDDGAPETTIHSGPPSSTDQTEATFAFSSDHADATFECSLDGVAFAGCSSPYTARGLAEGSHRLEVRSTRRVRAVDPTPASYEWTVAIPPETFIAGPDSPSASTSASITFTADDSEATFECSLNGALFEACSSPAQYADLGDGRQEVRVRGIDPFGNADPAPAVHAWTVAVPPETSIDSGAPDPSASSSASFAFSGTDNGTPASELAFECRLDGGEFAACASPALYEGLAEGAHSLEVRAIDAAGNVDAGPAAFGWTIDLTAPQTTIESGPGDPSMSSSAEFVFSADEDATFACSLDGGSFVPCSSPHSYHGLGEGGHSFQVRGIDRAGNVDASAADFGWSVDLTAPQTSIDSGPADPTKSTSASLTFSADEAASFECRLDGGEFVVCSSPQAHSALVEGPHALDVRAIDRAGNVDVSPARHVWTIDVTPPDASIGAAPADPTRDSSATILFSADEAASFECRLDGGEFVACSSPASYELLAEGRHSFEVRATDRAGNVEPSPAVSAWTIDLTAPETTIASGPPDPSNSSAAEFTFAANEEATFRCSLDGAPYAACRSSYDGLSEGVHALEARAIDRAGNEDASPAVHSWSVDLTAPETSIGSGPADPTASRSASFAFSADETATFECRLDGGAFTTCSTPAAYADLGQGAHSFDVRAIDRAGNADLSPARYVWTIDLTPPETSIDSAPADPTNSSAATFGFSASEQAAFECSLDGAPFAPCSSVQSYEGLAEGAHTFAVRAVDVVGNVDPTAAIHGWRIDQTAPETTIDGGPPDPTNQVSASFGLASDETGSSFECSLDGGAFAPCGSPAAYPNLAPGRHTFEVRATDAAGNTDATPAARSWTIDVAPPDTAVLMGPADPTNSTSASFALSADEPGSTFECRLDAGSFAACSSPATYEGLGEGGHALDVRAVDAAGNADPSPARWSWTIDVTPPQASIESGPADPTSSTSASFSFSADEQGSSFACSLDGAPFSACGSPATYSGLGVGAHGLRVLATDPAGNADPTPASHTWVVDTAAPETTIDSGPGTTTSTSATIAFSASEPGSTFECSLDGAAFASCASPREYTGLGEGAHEVRVRATDRAGNTDPTPAGHAWVIDRTPPDTAITDRPADPTNGATASFSLTGSDDRTPPTQLRLECRLDDQAAAGWVDCLSPRIYLGLSEGSHTFEARAVDLAGNADPDPAAYTWTIDRTAPETTIDSGPAATTTATSASFTFSANDLGSTFECSLDGSAFAPCSSPRAYAGLSLGGHEFEVRATDPAANTDASPAVYSWTIEAPPDTTAPETTIDSGPPAVTASTSASFSFSSSRPGSTFECSLDGSAFASCSSPRQYTALAGGAHQFRVRARDAAGNLDPTPASHGWTIDIVAPETTISSAPPASTASTSASFSFTANESDSTFECSLDSAAFAACSSPRIYTGLAGGAHQFRVRARDAVENLDSTPASHSWTIDIVAPETTISSAPPVLTASTSASFAFSANEASSTFECSLDGAVFAACTSPRQYTAVAAGAHQFRVRATDPAGNFDSTPASHSWTIDTAAPETTITSAPPATTTSTGASFAFSSSEGGSTFECSLDGATFAACVSPRQYTGLAVGSHQFRVRARDVAGNLDATPATHSWSITAPPAGCPAPTTLAALADAWIDENSATSNKGDDSILKVQSKGPRDNFRALLRFPIPTVPSGCRIDTATLRIYAASMKPDRVLQAIRLVSAWTEGGVTWSNQPATTGVPAATSSGLGYREWDVTSHVQAMLAGSANNGFMVRDAVESADAEQQFHSREKGESTPQLVVRFAGS